MIVKGTKKESKELRWLAKAQTKPSKNHPVLECFHKTDDFTVSCDGFRLHVIPTPECLEGAPENTKGKIHAGDFLAELEEQDVNYPDISQLVPKEEPTTEFAINPRFLRDALQGLSNPVVIKLHHQDTNNGLNPVEICGTGNEKRYGVVMEVFLERTAETYSPLT